MRCPDCNKFVSFDTETEPEEERCEVDEDRVTAEVRIVNTCAECGAELKEARFSFDEEIEDIEHKNSCKKKELSADAEWERTERTQNKDRHGKPIKSSRYMKHFYGVEGTVTVTCECGASTEVKLSDEIQASGMDELV